MRSREGTGTWRVSARSLERKTEMTIYDDTDIIRAVDAIVAEIERAVLAEDFARADALHARLFGHDGENAAQLVALARSLANETALAASAA